MITKALIYRTVSLVIEALNLVKNHLKTVQCHGKIGIDRAENDWDLLFHPWKTCSSILGHSN